MSIYSDPMGHWRCAECGIDLGNGTAPISHACRPLPANAGCAECARLAEECARLREAARSCGLTQRADFECPVLAAEKPAEPGGRPMTLRECMEAEEKPAEKEENVSLYYYEGDFGYGSFVAESDENARANVRADIQIVYRESDTADGRPFIVVYTRAAEKPAEPAGAGRADAKEAGQSAPAPEPRPDAPAGKKEDSNG